MKIGFVGCGKMAEAMISGIIRTGTVQACDIIASDVCKDRLSWVRRRHAIRTCTGNRDVLKAASTVFLAVKPQQFREVLLDLSEVASRRHLVISIAAGVEISVIERALPDARIVRVMPNMACTVSEAMSAYAPGSRATATDRRTVRRLLQSFGQAVELPERTFHAVTALSGSGPAFFAWCLDQMVAGAVKRGLSRQCALALAEQTMLGAAKLLIETGTDPADLISQVASARGTTAAGLHVLDRPATRLALRSTIRAAAVRSREISLEIRGTMA